MVLKDTVQYNREERYSLEHVRVEHDGVEHKVEHNRVDHDGVEHERMEQTFLLYNSARLGAVRGSEIKIVIYLIYQFWINHFFHVEGLSASLNAFITSIKFWT